MKLKINKTLVLLIIANSWSMFSVAQIQIRSGFVITNTGDSVNGFFENRRTSSNSVWFRKGINEKANRLDQKQIKVYGNERGYYEVIEIGIKKGKKSAYFAQPLIKGKLSLYDFEGGLYLKHDSLGTFKIKENRSKNSPIDKKDLGILKLLTYKCKSSRASSDSLNLKREVILNFIQRSNQCLGSSSKIYSIPKRRGKTEIGLFLGENISLLRLPFMSDLRNLSFEANTSLVLGLSIAFVKNNTSLAVDVSYLNGNYHGSGFAVTYREPKSVYFKTSFVRAGLSYRAIFPVKWADPFIGGGLSLYMPLKYSYVFVKNGVSYPDPEADKSIPDLIGIGPCAGLQRKLNNRFGVFFEIRVEKVVGGFANNLESSILNSTFLIGLKFL
jgi:hypothetical protein